VTDSSEPDRSGVDRLQAETAHLVGPFGDPRQAVRREGRGTIRIAGEDHEVAWTFVGGRSRHSVGGRIAEGARRWCGQIRWLPADDAPSPGATVTVVLDDGRAATATVASTVDADGLLTVRGVGAPPFDVP
jgi:hypothetical protein